MSYKPKSTKIENGSWTVFLSFCKGCGICLEKCPFKALSYSKDEGVYSNETPEVDPKLCNLCGICELFCPDCAIRVDKVEESTK